MSEEEKPAGAHIPGEKHNSEEDDDDDDHHGDGKEWFASGEKSSNVEGSGSSSGESESSGNAEESSGSGSGMDMTAEYDADRLHPDGKESVENKIKKVGISSH